MFSAILSQKLIFLHIFHDLSLAPMAKSSSTFQGLKFWHIFLKTHLYQCHQGPIRACWNLKNYNKFLYCSAGLKIQTQHCFESLPNYSVAILGRKTILFKQEIWAKQSHLCQKFTKTLASDRKNTDIKWNTCIFYLGFVKKMKIHYLALLFCASIVQS
jgi:hypothetical protein